MVFAPRTSGSARLVVTLKRGKNILLQANVTSQFVVHRIKSEVLKGNPLGDPSERDVCVYLPPIDESSQIANMPVLLALAGFTGTGKTLFNFDPRGEDLKHRLDRLILSGACPPVIVVAPDCYSKLGGNQYINSSAVGLYEDHLVKEVIPFINDTYAVGPWGVFGKSSGGYGSLVLGMRHPEIFRVLASHSGDSVFELSYLSDFLPALDAFRKHGGPKAWFEAYLKDVNPHRSSHFIPLEMLAMSATYSPNPQSKEMGIDFPFDLETGVFLPDVWARWRQWDPVNMIPSYVENLKKLAFIYMDCGSRDEHGLHWGVRAIVAALKKYGIPAHHEEFDDGHRSVTYRYDVSLPLLSRALHKLAGSNRSV